MAHRSMAMVFITVILVIMTICGTATALCTPITSAPYPICSNSFPDWNLPSFDFSAAVDNLLTGVTDVDFDCDTYKACDVLCPVTLSQICISWNGSELLQTPCDPITNWRTNLTDDAIIPANSCYTLGFQNAENGMKFNDESSATEWYNTQCLPDNLSLITTECSYRDETDDTVITYAYSSTDPIPVKCNVQPVTDLAGSYTAPAECYLWGCGGATSFDDLSEKVAADFTCTEAFCTSDMTRNVKCLLKQYNIADLTLSGFSGDPGLVLLSLADCQVADELPSCTAQFCTPLSGDQDSFLATYEIAPTQLTPSTLETCPTQTEIGNYCKSADTACIDADVTQLVACYLYKYVPGTGLLWDSEIGTASCALSDPVAVDSFVHTLFNINCDDSCEDFYFYATITLVDADPLPVDASQKTLTELDILVWEDVKADLAEINPTEITCTGYDYEYKLAKVALLLDSTDPSISTQTVISIGAPTSRTIVGLEDQCITTCSYDAASTFITCREDHTSCTACVAQADFETKCGIIVPPTVADEACTTTTPTNQCACTVFCDAKNEAVPTVGDEITSTTAIECQTESFRPDKTYCFGGVTESDSIRDVFCVFTHIDSTDSTTTHFYAGVDCDSSVATLEAVQFEADPSKCTVGYECGPDADNLSPCTCPAETPAQGEASCASAGIVSPDVDVVQCTATWSNGVDPVVDVVLTDLAECCSLNSAVIGTTPGSNCGCPCLEYEWQCYCKPEGFESLVDTWVLCDCAQPDVANAAICPEGATAETSSACSSLPVTVKCAKVDVDANTDAESDDKCLFIEAKPTITSYTCPPTEEFPIGSEKCPLTTSCYNSNETIAEAYDCSTCVDTVGGATGRTVVCSVEYQNLSTAETGLTFDVNSTCPTEITAQHASCTSTPAPTDPAGTYTRGDAISYTWTYIGPAITTKSLTFQPIDHSTVQGGFVIVTQQDQITVLESAKTVSYTPTKTLALPVITNLHQIVDGQVLPAEDDIEVTLCTTTDSACLTKLCIADGTTCGAQGSCVYDETTTFTKCACNEGFSGPACQFQTNCPYAPATDPAPCYNNGFMLTGADCKTCQCSGQWAGDECNSCTMESITTTCQAGHFIPSTSSKQCTCNCFYGYGGSTCQLQVDYATVTLNIPPNASLTAGTTWEREWDLDTLPPVQKRFVSWLAAELKDLTKISTIIPIEFRTGTTANTWIYVIRFEHSGTALAQWQAFRTSTAPFQLQQVQTTPLSPTNPSNAYNPLCGGASCTDGSPYTTRQRVVDCVASPTDPVCATSYGTLKPPGPEKPIVEDKGSSKTGLIVGLVVGLICGAILIGLIIFFVLKKMKGGDYDSQPKQQTKQGKSSQQKQKQQQQQHQASDPFPFQLEDSPDQSSPVAPKAPKAPGQSHKDSNPKAPKAPKAPQPHKSSRAERETELASTPHKSSNAGRRNQDDDALPFPWKRCTDHLGNIYYINMHTMESSFQKPTV